ncbi:MAG: IclR family transcriptional regulator [Pseudomonadota bacterium]
MKTVDKAMQVLDQFSLEQTEIGLSELARMAGLDKAATRRLLVALSEHGFIEQAADTRKYRLGHGFLRLARIREATVPLSDAAQEVANWLAEVTNETVHVSLPGPHGMTTIAHRLPNRGRVVNITPAELLLFHATASGLAYLAFATPATVERVLELKREKMTEATLTDRNELLSVLKHFRAQGFSQTSNTFEADVASIAMPFFQHRGDPTGTLAIALPKAEMTDAQRETLLPHLKEGIARIQKALTGL